MAKYVVHSRLGLYPISLLFNPSIRDNSLYVPEIGHFIHTPGEYLPHVSANYCFHIIINGSVEINGRKLQRGDCYLHSTSSYTVRKAQSAGFEETFLGFSGHAAKKIIQDLGVTSDVAYFSLNDNIDFLAEAIYHDYVNTNLDAALLSKLYMLLSYLLPPTSSAPSYFKPSQTFSPNANKHLLAAVDYIYKNYDKNITVKDIAKHAHVTENYLCKVFKANTRYTTQSFLANYRISIATQLLSTTNYSIQKIAFLTGYDNEKYFSQVFKSRLHFTPSKYRKLTTLPTDSMS